MSKKQGGVDTIKEYLHKIIAAYALDAQSSQMVFDSFSQDKKSALRINTLKAPLNDTFNLLRERNIALSAISWSECSFILEDKSAITRLAESRDGLFYIQNLSSQLTVVAMQPQAGNFILDLAAAPGGKTSYIAQLMNNQGKISAVEPVKDRYYRLIANLKNLGVSIARCYNKDGRVVGKLCQEWFDQVLLDAPCSSMAQIDFRNEESYQHWNYKKVKDCSRKQKHLIESAFQSLKPAGEMIYSTCSWMVEENEMVVDHLIKTFPEQVEILPIEMPITNYLNGLRQYEEHTFDEQVALSIRIVPNDYFEAFYMVKIKKKG